jgi:hypothetical protein
MFKIDAAKEAGYTDTEIAEYLAQQNNFDVKAARESGYDDGEIADFLSLGREITAGEAYGRATERLATGVVRGGGELLKEAGIDTSQTRPVVETPGYEDPLAWMSSTPLSIEQERSSLATPGERQLTDIERQQEYQIGLRRQTGASIAGIVTGAVVDPTNLVGFTAKTITKGMLQLGSLGAVTGAVEPVYEEFGDDRLTNIAIGTGIGSILGGGFGALAARQARKAGEVSKAATEASDAPVKTREQIEAELPKLEPTDNLPTLLSKAPEADQLYVDKILSRYDDDEAIPVNVLNEIADTVEDKDVAALFKGAAKQVADAVPENQAAKAAQQQQESLTAAATEASTGGKALSKSSIQQAEKTGDYRDYLTTSVVRLRDIPPAQFAKMTAAENPYSGQNFKTLISRLGADDPDLQQIYGGIQGRLKYERQTGKTFDEITKQALDEVPESVAINALLSKKVEEILPPEIYASAIRATGRAVDDLLNAQDLARYARESGSEEAYAVLQSQMSRASSLISALEGNASNLGRALAYQKTLKDLIDSNSQLPGYLGGVKC